MDVVALLAEGGGGRRPVEMIVEDSEGVPATALTKVRRLVEQAEVHTAAGLMITLGAGFRV
jgi:ABC-type branched-subunit amino acid transport system substrate-binding protein